MTGPRRSTGPPIVVLHDAPELYLDLLRARFADLAFETCTSEPEIREALARLRPEVAFSVKCPGLDHGVHRLLLDCPSLRWIQVGGAGVDHLGPWDPARVTVTNCAGVLSRFQAETVTGAILMLNFGFPRYLRQQAERIWRQQPWGPLSEKTLLVVGLGNIGAKVAANAKALGMTVVGLRRSAAAIPQVDEMLPLEALHEGLARADFVTLHVPLTAETRHLIDADALAAMQPGAFLINTARGPVVDEAALIAALQSGGLAGAYLDVFEVEPLPPASPLWSLESVVISPHFADAAAGWERRFAAFFADNLMRWLAGQPLEKPVAPDA